jgi:hypothetical protein
MLGGYERFGRDPNAAYAAPLGPSVYQLQDLSANDWIFAIYAQGAAFYGDVYNALGHDAFWDAMREVYATQVFGILTPWELLTTFQQHASEDLRPLYETYFTYAWLGTGDQGLGTGGLETGNATRSPVGRCCRDASPQSPVPTPPGSSGPSRAGRPGSPQGGRRG